MALGSNFTTTGSTGLPYFVDEPLKTSFDDVLLESFSKFVQFTLASTNLMIDCLQREKYPTFHEIHEANGTFHSLLTSHRRTIDVNDVIHTQERWEKLQKSLKLIETTDGVRLSPLDDTNKDKLFL